VARALRIKDSSGLLQLVANLILTENDNI